MKKTYGLIGFPLGHSFSQKYFSEKFENERIDAQYELFPLEKIEDVISMMDSTPLLVGFNVTIPYKQQIMRYLDAIDSEAAECGAVNVVKIDMIDDVRRLKGYNSDIYGFYESIKPLIKSHHRKALILGTGGASKAVAAMMRKLSIDYKFVSRTPNGENVISYNDIDKEVIQEHSIIVNTSPLGMSPKTDVCPDIPYENINENHLVYDLVYNPLETLFLKKAKEQGATIKNGLEMLHLQAEKAWQIWNM